MQIIFSTLRIYSRISGPRKHCVLLFRREVYFLGIMPSTLDKNLRLSPLRATAAPKLMLRGGGILVLEKETGNEVVGSVYAGGVESSKVNTGGAL